MKKKSRPKYLIIYECGYCGNDSGFTELETPRCRFCDKSNKLTIVTKQKITAEVIFARLKVVADRMMSHLNDAYQYLSDAGENIAAEGRDAESETLMLMERAKRLRDKLYQLEPRSRKKK